MNSPAIDFHFDFETRSRLDLRKVGAVKYAAHPSTEATLITWAFGRTGKVKPWRIGQPIPDDLRDVLENPHKYRFIAYNLDFDFMIWTLPFFRQVAEQGIVGRRPTIGNLSDCMALANHFRVATSLEKTAQMLDLHVSKDKEGRRLMLKQCKPQRDGTFYELTDAEWMAFERYGLIDTVMLRDIYYRLPQLPAAERWIYEWTTRRNLTGIKVDTHLIQIMKEIVEFYYPKMEKEFFQITGVKVKSPKCLGYFQPHFPWIKNMQAATVRDMLLKTEGIDPTVVRALELKSLAGSTSISKVKCATEMMHNGRIYGLLAYHIAQTKRFAGRGIQIQNFPRPGYNPVDELPKNLDIVNLAEEVRSRANTLKDPIDFVKNLLRRIWIVEPGNHLYCSDFSKVEPTFLYWLVGMGPVSPTAYEEMAVEIYTKPLCEISKDSEERQVGKAAVLGGGYGMGHKKFKDDVAKNTGIVMTLEFSKHVIDTYRKVNRPIAEFWKSLQTAFRHAISGQSTVLCDGKIHVMPMQSPWKGVMIRLPSGSHLYYHKAHVDTEIEEQEIVEIINGQTVVRKISRAVENLYYVTDKDGRIKRTKIYGGLLCEHVTSATSRDLLGYAMYNLEQAGFNILTSIHDEVWGEATPGREKEFEEVMCILPHWCKDLKVTADTGEGLRYLK